MLYHAQKYFWVSYCEHQNKHRFFSRRFTQNSRSTASQRKSQTKKCKEVSPSHTNLQHQYNFNNSSTKRSQRKTNYKVMAQGGVYLICPHLKITVKYFFKQTNEHHQQQLKKSTLKIFQGYGPRRRLPHMLSPQQKPLRSRIRLGRLDNIL